MPDPPTLIDAAGLYTASLFPVVLADRPKVVRTTVPFLAPSLNNPRRLTYAPVDIAYTPDYGRFTAHANHCARDQRNQRAVDFCTPAPRPNKANTYFPYLQSQAAGIDGFEKVTAFGFGYAPSPYLKCMQDGKTIDALYVDMGEIKCVVPPAETVGSTTLEATNMAGAGAGCGEDTVEGVEFPSKLVMSELAIYYDGVRDFAYSETAAEGLGPETGVTFGAWFYPMNDDATSEQPIVCFSDPCTSPPSPPPPPPPPPVPVLPSEGGRRSLQELGDGIHPSVLTRTCLMYRDQHVYVQSDLAPTSYNNLDFTNVTSVGMPAKAHEWHYAEVSIDAKEILVDIESDGFNATGNVREAPPWPPL